MDWQQSGPLAGAAPGLLLKSLGELRARFYPGLVLGCAPLVACLWYFFAQAPLPTCGCSSRVVISPAGGHVLCLPAPNAVFSLSANVLCNRYLHKWVYDICMRGPTPTRIKRHTVFSPRGHFGHRLRPARMGELLADAGRFRLARDWPERGHGARQFVCHAVTGEAAILPGGEASVFFFHIVGFQDSVPEVDLFTWVVGLCPSVHDAAVSHDWGCSHALAYATRVLVQGPPPACHVDVECVSHAPQQP